MHDKRDFKFHNSEGLYEKRRKDKRSDSMYDTKSDIGEKKPYYSK